MKSLSIGQVATAVGVTVETLRYYEQEGLLAEPSRTSSRYRRYGDDALHRLRFILRAKEYGFTLREIKELLGYYDSLSSHRQEVGQATDEKITAVEAQIRQLQSTQELLLRLRDLCHGCRGCDNPGGLARECPILMTIAGIGPGCEASLVATSYEPTTGDGFRAKMAGAASPIC
jgi:DNA-binding transcriptional MerR regulator